MEAVLTIALAGLLWHFWLPGVLILVTIDGIVAVAATALLRASATRVTVADMTGKSVAGLDEQAQEAAVEAAQRQANATLNFAFMGALAIGPVIGGALVDSVGGSVALLLDAFTFLVCAALLAHLSTHIAETSGDSIRARLRAVFEHVRAVPALRALFITEAIALVFFASVEPVEVLYTKSTLDAGDLGYGLLMGAWGLARRSEQSCSHARCAARSGRC